jgi:chitosanase
MTVNPAAPRSPGCRRGPEARARTRHSAPAKDSAVDAVYYGAALQKAHDKKFKKALTIVSLWDARIMHGASDQKFGTVVMMGMADKMVTLSYPPTDMEESNWLAAFHKVRAMIMTTRGEWRGNIYRVATYEQLRRAGNMDFKGCVQTGNASASDYWSVPGGKSPSFNVCGD